MRKLLLIARSNMRKAKGQTAAIVVLILIAALMLNLWLMLSMDYKANFDRYHDKLNAEHVTLAVDGTDEMQEFLSQMLESDIIVAFVLFLLVRTMLNNKMRDYGILKSLGFTTKQLILQTALLFMPAIIISTVIGIIISCLAINPLMSLFLSSLGIVKCTFNVPIVFSTIAGIALILVSFGIACLLSLKIKKIAPRNLLVGE